MIGASVFMMSPIPINPLWNENTLPWKENTLSMLSQTHILASPSLFKHSQNTFTSQQLGRIM